MLSAGAGSSPGISPRTSSRMIGCGVKGGICFGLARIVYMKWLLTPVAEAGMEKVVRLETEREILIGQSNWM